MSAGPPPWVPWYILFAGGWAVVNGVLHDIFVLAQRRPFDRELIRLLGDGHVLIFGGVVYLLCFKALRAGEPWAYAVSAAAAFFLLGYCALVWKLVPSVGMVIVNAMALLALLIGYRSLAR